MNLNELGPTSRQWRDRIALAAHQRRVPDYMVDPLLEYVIHGSEPGDFLEELLTNDLMGVFRVADTANRAAISDWVLLVFNDLPVQCHGSRDIVTKWVVDGGLRGRESTAQAEASASA